MGRPKKYFTEEDRIKAYHQSKNKYMVNKEWLCPDCGNRNYSLAGKWTHLQTNISKMHPKIKKKIRCANHIQTFFIFKNILVFEYFRFKRKSKHI